MVLYRHAHTTTRTRARAASFYFFTTYLLTWNARKEERAVEEEGEEASILTCLPASDPWIDGGSLLGATFDDE
jgi:hypothetical protein